MTLAHSNPNLFFTFPTDNEQPFIPSPPPELEMNHHALGFDSFTSDSSYSPASFGELDFENTFGLSPVATASTASIISPKSILQDVSFDSLDFETSISPIHPDVNTAEALSNHHLQRYIHYKTLAAQAEAQARIATEQLESLFASYGMPIEQFAKNEKPFQTQSQSQSQSQSQTQFKDLALGVNTDANMLAFQPQTGPVFTQPWSYATQPETSASFHAQAQAHLQAHQQVKSIVTPVSVTNQFFAPSRTEEWSRQSSAAQSVASLSAPTTPTVLVAPAIGAPVSSTRSSSSSEGENEVDSASETSSSFSGGRKTSLDGLTNLHGGGRGYIPGQTPDDPKKRHKCTICGRGFARAFNLKSHVQTHDVSRSKPYTCPHAGCHRGFSRLHDLERHRQGIHSDGPLVESKSQGVAPSVARAKERIGKHSDTGNLI